MEDHLYGMVAAFLCGSTLSQSLGAIALISPMQAAWFGGLVSLTLLSCLLCLKLSKAPAQDWIGVALALVVGLIAGIVP